MLAVAAAKKDGSGWCWGLVGSFMANIIYSTMTRFTDMTAKKPLTRVIEEDESLVEPGNIW